MFSPQVTCSFSCHWVAWKELLPASPKPHVEGGYALPSLAVCAMCIQASVESRIGHWDSKSSGIEDCELLYMDAVN